MTVLFNTANQIRCFSINTNRNTNKKTVSYFEQQRPFSSVAVEEITEPAQGTSEAVVIPPKQPKNVKIHQNDIRYSPKRMNQVARFIQGKEVDQALLQLKYLERPIASLLSRVILNGVNQAETKYGLRQEDMILKTFIVGPGVKLRRHNFQGRGHSGILRHRYSNIFIILEEGKLPAGKYKSNRIENKKMKIAQKKQMLGFCG